MEIKEKWASLFIPKETIYCHHRFRYSKKYKNVVAKPCKYFCYKYNEECNSVMEYCKFCKNFLQIQDQVKDCYINMPKEW